MLFVTACDSKDRYFSYLLSQIGAIDKHFGTKPFVYNLGLSHDQCGILANHYGINAINCPPYKKAPGDNKNYPHGYRPMALFKPSLLVDFCDRYRNKRVMYLDADARPMKYFEFQTDNVGLVRVPNEELERREKPLFFGPYHAGIIFLEATKDRLGFLLAWARDLSDDNHSPSDTKSLNKVIQKNNIPITDLSSNEFNSPEADAPNVYIVHERF